MPQNKHKSWCRAQHQQATKDADDQEWTYLGTGTKKQFPTSFDTHIAGQHTGQDAEAAKDVEEIKKKKKKKKGRNKISPREDGTVPAFSHMLNPAFVEEQIHSSRARAVIDLCPGSGQPALACMGELIDLCPGSGQRALACMGGPIPFMGHTPSHWPHSEIGPRTPPGTPPADKPFFITKSGVAGFSNGAVFHPLQATVAS